jgi:phosphate uptake regulator
MLGGNEMRELPLNRRIDHILDVLYDAADVPQIHRKYVGYVFEDAVDDMVEDAVSEYMDDKPNSSEDIKDLDDRVEKLEDALATVSRVLGNK